MNASDIRLIYLIFFLLELGWETILTRLNLLFLQKTRGSVPEEFAASVDSATYERSAAYNLERGRFSLLANFASSLVVLALIFPGALGLIDVFFRQWNIHPYIAGILFIFGVSLILYVCALPFSLYSQFVVEERYGFNKMTGGLFVRDAVKSLVVSVVVFSPLLAALFWFMDSAGRYWWIIAFGFTALFQLFVSLLYPLLIAPLFNKFTTLEEGHLREKIAALAHRLSFNIKGVFVMDGSKRSRHSNAYFTGLG